MNYSLFRSKTFYTLLFLFVFNGFAAISGQLPSQVTVLGDLILSSLASYFHLQTGNSVTGAN